MQIKTKLLTELVSKEDGFRVFIERRWPHGVKREAAPIELWFKIIAPSAELYKQFQLNPSQWLEFKQSYFNELSTKKDLLKNLLLSGPHKIVTLLHTMPNQEHNSAVALKEFLENLSN